MQNLITIVLVLFFYFHTFSQASPPEVQLFDGSSFNGWEGDTVNIWKIDNQALVGGSLKKTLSQNEFLSTTKSYKNFKLRLQFKLLGNEGVVNSGVMFHSKRILVPPNEMTGYQADLGDGFWGCLYDESRRNKILAQADSTVVNNHLRRNKWNDYEVHTENGTTRIILNGKKTMEYTEDDTSIPQHGVIGLQIHGGGKAQVCFREIYILELP